MIIFASTIDPGKIGPDTYVITRNESGRIEMCQYAFLKFNSQHVGDVTIIGTAPSKEKGISVIREIIEKSAAEYS